MSRGDARIEDGETAKMLAAMLVAALVGAAIAIVCWNGALP